MSDSRTGTELAAQTTAARAVLGDYRRDVLDGLADGPEPDWAAWSHRLGGALGALVDIPGAPAAAVTPANPLDVAGRIEEHAGTLGVALAQWVTRDDSTAQPHVRQAANTAMDEIDAMLRELHQARGQLVAEMRASDDVTGRRVNELLAGNGTR